jgi:uncharacterized coiled-coil protein SlyX
MNFKSLFFKDDGTEPIKASDASKAAQPVSANAPISTPAATFNNPMTINGAVDEKMYKAIMDVLDRTNIPGPDYYELMKALEAMNSIPMDERTKFLSAFATLSTQGSTKKIILNAIDTYLKEIEKERLDFQTDMTNQYNSNVKSRQDLIVKTQKQIDDLNAKLAELNTLIINTSQESASEDLKIKSISANFEATLNYVVGRINADKDKIIQYIPDTPATK